MATVHADRGLIVVTAHREVRSMTRAFLARNLPIAFDIETTGLDPRAGYLVTLQFHQAGHSVVVLDARNMEWVVLSDALAPLFSGGHLVIGHNLKFDFGWLMEKLEIYPTRAYDTFLAEQMIHGVGRSDAKARGIDLTLKGLSKHYLGREMSKEERNWFIDLDQRPEWDEPLPLAQVEYAAEDVRALPPIYEAQVEQIDAAGLREVAHLEMRALPAITSIEQSGIRVDVDGWRAFIAEKEAEAREIESRALEVFGAAIISARVKAFDAALSDYAQWTAAKSAEETRLRAVFDEPLGTTTNEYQPPKWGDFKTAGMGIWRSNHPNPGKPKMDQSAPNLGSPAQLQTALREMGISVSSTASEVLATLEDDHPEVALLLTYRKAQKFVDSFGEALLHYVVEGRIHPEYVQIGASTGRMSCTRPNWQQVPSKGDGARLRELVVAGPGNKLLTADFSNIELRILADLSRDKTMLDLFASGEDLHSYTARMMFGLDAAVDVKHTVLPGSDVTYRAVAKTINFGLVYGMSPTKLARTVHVTPDRAKELFNAYFRLYPTVAKWLGAQREYGVSHAKSVTLAGRKRYYLIPSAPPFPTTRATDAVTRWKEAQREHRGILSRIERQSMNTPIQGTSADITKLALANLYETGILQNGLDIARIVAVVHDEIVLECAAAVVGTVSATLSKAMGDAASTYLHYVTLPPVEVAVAGHWSKE